MAPTGLIGQGALTGEVCPSVVDSPIDCSRLSSPYSSTKRRSRVRKDQQGDGWTPLPANIWTGMPNGATSSIRPGRDRAPLRLPGSAPLISAAGDIS